MALELGLEPETKIREPNVLKPLFTHDLKFHLH